MPRKSDSLAINNPKHDKRVKLTDDDKQQIRDEYATGNYSQRALAAKWGVSRRSIQFAINPESLEQAKKLYNERRKDGRYYDKDKHAKATREHRDHKKELYEQGLIKDREEDNNEQTSSS